MCADADEAEWSGEETGRPPTVARDWESSWRIQLLRPPWRARTDSHAGQDNAEAHTSATPASKHRALAKHAARPAAISHGRVNVTHQNMRVMHPRISIRSSPRRTWLDERVDVFVDELSGLGLVASRKHVAELIADRVVGERTARRYLSEALIRDLARELAVTLADEQPGTDVLEGPRTIPMAPASVGPTIAARAEALHVSVLNDDAVGTHGALQVISLLGQITPPPRPVLDVLDRRSGLRAVHFRRRSGLRASLRGVREPAGTPAACCPGTTGPACGCCRPGRAGVRRHRHDLPEVEVGLCGDLQARLDRGEGRLSEHPHCQ
jgi:hypothetical protein